MSGIAPDPRLIVPTMAELPLASRIGVITGATSGIGRAIAERLIAQGARVVVNGRRKDKLDESVKALNSGRREPAAVGVMGDCAEPAVIEGLFAAAKKHFGADADAVVVNAGRGLAGGVLSSDTSQWEEMIRTNMLGAARLMRAAAEKMLAAIGVDPAPDVWQKRAHDIVVIGSVVGRHVSPFSSMYGSTKFGVHGMTEGLRREVASKGIRVTLVEPGFVVSEFQGVAGYKEEWFRGVVEKIGPVLKPEDVARPVAFVLAQPANVHVSDVLIRPTRQDYP